MADQEQNNVEKGLQNGAKSAAKEGAKIAGKLLKKGLSFLIGAVGGLPVIIGLVAVVAIIPLITGIWDFVENVKDALTGSYTSESEYYASKDTLGLADAAAGVFYTRFAEQSYYITVDDDPGIYQVNSPEFAELESNFDAPIKDIDNREGQFALSPTMIMLLDEKLNEGFINPEQFIKPVYNSCMALNGEKTTTCALLDLVDENGNVVADSVYYREREEGENPIHDVEGEVERTEIEQDYNTKTSIFDKNPNATTKGVWDWGFGSIIHYKSFIQDSRINNYQIRTVKVWDAENRQTVLIDGFATLADRETYIDTYGFVEPEKVITYETQVDEAAKNVDGLSLAVPETETKFAIDHVASFVGTMTNNLQQSYIFQGKSGGTSVIKNYYYEYDSFMEDSTTDGGVRVAYRGPAGIGKVSKQDDTKPFGVLSTNSPVYSNFNTVKFEPEEWEEHHYPNPNYDEVLCLRADTSGNIQGTNVNVCDREITERILVHPDRYNFDNGAKYVDASLGELSFTIRYNPEITYYKEGNLETNAVRYTNTNPDTSGVIGVKYLEDYIINYESYVPYETVQQYKCYVKDINDDALYYGDVSGYSFNSFDEPSSIVSSVQECENNSFTTKMLETGTMDGFHFDDLPYLQIRKMADVLDINLDNVSDSVVADEVQLSEVDVLLKTFTNEEKTAFQEKMANVYKKYKQHFDNAATKYGIDVYLLAAIATQETSGNDTNNLMQIRNLEPERTITAYNFSTRKNNDLTVNTQTMSDVSLNIQAAAMELQNLLVKYKYNALIAIQAYNYGEEATDQVLTLYENETGVSVDEAVKNNSDYGWTTYTYEMLVNHDKYLDNWDGEQNGDYEYTKNILKFLPSTQLTFQSAMNDVSKHSLKQINFAELYDVSSEGWSLALDNKTAVSKRYRKLENTLKDQWPLLTAGQKSYDAGSYNDASSQDNNLLKTSLEIESSIHKNVINKSPKIAERILTSLGNELDRKIFIQKLFAYQNGDNYHDYDVYSEEFWASKYSSLFKSVDSKSWNSHIDIQEVFGGFISIPLETYTISRPYGYETNAYGHRELNEITEFETKPNSEVKAAYKGSVINVSERETDKYGKFIEILHNKEGDSLTTTTYAFLDKIDVNIGDEVETGDVIGTVSKDGKLGVVMSIGGVNDNFGQVVNTVEAYYREEFLLMSTPGYSGPQNVEVTEYLKALLPIADEVEKLMKPATGWNLSSLTDTSKGRKTAGTWVYYGTSTDHPAMDWGTPIGTEFYAFGDVIILNLLDNCVDYPTGTNFEDAQNSDLLACNGKYGNKIVAVFKHEDGNLYATTLLHAQHASMRNTLPAYTEGDASSFIVSDGSVIALSGHTGISTGPHEHIELVNFGHMSLADIVRTYLESNFDSYFGIGYTPAQQSRCESNSGARPCKERPDYKFSY